MGKSSKTIENKCSHSAFRPTLIGKLAHRKGNIKHVRTWSQAISSNFSCLLRSKIAKIAKVKCTHRSTNPFDASIPTIARPPSLYGYTPLSVLKLFMCVNKWHFLGSALIQRNNNKGVLIDMSQFPGYIRYFKPKLG